MGVKERKDSLYFQCLLNHSFWVILKNRHNLSNKNISKISLLRIFFWDLPRFPYNCLIIPAFLQNMKGGHKGFSICGAVRGCFINCTLKKINKMPDLWSAFKDIESQKCLRREKQNQRRWDKITLLQVSSFYSSLQTQVILCYQLIVFHIITFIFLPVKTLSGQE